jgi:hypothetical protein
VAICIDALVKAKRWCMLAAFPSLMGLAPALLLAWLNPRWVVLPVTLLVGHFLLVDGKLSGALLQLGGVGFMAADLTRVMRDIAKVARPNRESDWTWQLVAMLVVVSAWLIAGVAAGAHCQRVAARFPVFHSRVSPRRGFARFVLALRSPRRGRALKAWLTALSIGLPILGLIVVIIKRPQWAMELDDWVYEASTMVKVAIFVAFVVISSVLSTLMSHFETTAKRAMAVAAADARRLDRRAPILLLRSFGDDLSPIRPRFTPGPYHATSNIEYPAQWTLEEVIEATLDSVGPVIAIGRPGESLPPAGAAREYVPEDEWQDRVAHLVQQSRWIVVLLGKTPGLAAEYCRLRELNVLSKTIVVFPALRPEEIQARWTLFKESTGISPTAGEAEELGRALVATFIEGATDRLITCRDRDDESYELALQCALGLLARGPDGSYLADARSG